MIVGFGYSITLKADQAPISTILEHSELFSGGQGLAVQKVQEPFSGIFG